MRSPAGGTSDDARSVEAPVDLLEGSAYRVVGALGAGGMGEVLEAEHRALGHRVVVKVMREELAARPEMLDRMRVEAQSLARIRHPGLVMVTDFGQTRSGRPFIVMEKLHGRSLQEEIAARSALPVAEAAEIGRQVLLGLSAAHAAGLVHRDVKPDNVFLCASEDGRPLVKVLDFGVVKIVQAGHDPRTPQPPVIPTAENITLGTPRYFSPEQTYGARDLDARSDLYSVGLVLYAMVVGRGPFDHHRRWQDLFLAHTTEAPMPPSLAAPQPIPAAFERMVMRALAKPREERYQDALSFAEDLSRFLSSLGAEGHRVNATVQVPEDEQETIELEDREEPTFAAAEQGSYTIGIHTEQAGAAGTRTPGAAAGAAGATGTAGLTGAPGPGGVPGSEEPTATASPVVAPRRDVVPAGRLPDGPVMIDNLVERVLGSAAPPRNAPLAPARAAPPAADRTAPLAPRQAAPVAPEQAASFASPRTTPLAPKQAAPLAPGMTAPLAPGMTAPLAPGMTAPLAPGMTAPLAPLPAARPSSPEPTEPDAPAEGRLSIPSPTEPMSASGVAALLASSPGRASRPSVPETAPMFEVPARPSAPGAPPPSVALRSPVPSRAAGAAWRAPVIAGAAALLVLLGALIGYLLR